MSPDFVEYQRQVLKNAKVMANALVERGYKIVSGKFQTVCLWLFECGVFLYFSLAL